MASGNVLSSPIKPSTPPTNVRVDFLCNKICALVKSEFIICIMYLFTYFGTVQWWRIQLWYNKNNFNNMNGAYLVKNKK